MLINRPKVALYQPRIPQNTGNIGRTCLAFNLKLDLIRPLGFEISDKYLKRAGLDYWKNVEKTIYESYNNYKSVNSEARIIGFSKKSTNTISNFQFEKSDILLFGREDTGLPKEVRDSCYKILCIPMPGNKKNLPQVYVRSLNLSVACGIVIYQVCHQLGMLETT